jgi:SNF2 family DNA or RNA helicase
MQARAMELPAELSIYRTLIERLDAGVALDERGSTLVEEALSAAVSPGFDAFVSLPRLRFTPFAHQLAAAKTVLTRLRSRAILADEVGLGKTIEACLVLSELFLRRLVQRTLILVPAGLVEQWAEELDRKFALPFIIHGSEAWSRRLRPWQEPIVIGSLATLRRAPWRDAAAQSAWDLVIVDEAHRLKNPRSASTLLVKSLQTPRLLLLTATPVENRLEDLFHLAGLVRPGHLGTPKEFRARHSSATVSVARVAELDGLQRRMRDVMVRHRRSEVALMLPRRLAETIRIAPRAEEAELYALVSRRIRERAGEAPAPALLALRNAQRLAGSSPSALAPSLERLGWTDLAERAKRITAPTEKGRALLEVLRRHCAGGQKVVVFTAFRETLRHLEELSESMPFTTVSYHGSLGRQEKNDVMRAFADEAQVLLTTEAAGEGRNLQFCHVMVNYDLPWNPMQIEQRLGRIHRIGQQHDVLLINLVTRETIEDRILHVLEAKINLFELVVGELDMILGRIDDDFDFEASLFAAHVESSDDDDFARRVDAFGDQLSEARHSYLESRAMTDELVPPTKE